MVTMMPPRHWTMREAASRNTGMMVGVDPSFANSDFPRTLAGPQAMIAWILGAQGAIADGMVWGEPFSSFQTPAGMQ